MRLVHTIPLELVRIGFESPLYGFEGYTLIWTKTELKIYKETL